MRAAAMAFLVAAALPAAASATPVTVVFGGVWDDLVDDTAGALNGQVTLGSSFTVTMTYDDVAPDSNASPTQGDYDVSASFAFEVATGPFTITYAPGGSADITVDAFGSDEVILFAQGAFVGSPNLPAFTAVSYTNPGFTDASGTALSSDLLSGVPWQSSAWDDAYMYLILDDDDGTQATYVELAGTITSMTVVPEPTSFGLVAAGAIALALRARGRARSAA